MRAVPSGYDTNAFPGPFNPVAEPIVRFSPNLTEGCGFADRGRTVRTMMATAKTAKPLSAVLEATNVGTLQANSAPIPDPLPTLERTIHPVRSVTTIPRRRQEGGPQ